MDTGPEIYRKLGTLPQQMTILPLFEYLYERCQWRSKSVQ
jgi:hypothetical protein